MSFRARLARGFIHFKQFTALPTIDVYIEQFGLSGLHTQLFQSALNSCIVSYKSVNELLPEGTAGWGDVGALSDCSAFDCND